MVSSKLPKEVVSFNALCSHAGKGDAVIFIYSPNCPASRSALKAVDKCGRASKHINYYLVDVTSLLGREIARTERVKTYPTLLFIEDQSVKGRHIGSLTLSELKTLQDKRFNSHG